MSLWLIPMIYAAASFLGGITLPRLEQAYFPTVPAFPLPRLRHSFRLSLPA